MNQTNPLSAQQLTDLLNLTPDQLIPTIVQDDTTRQVLMLAYSNLESLRATFNAGEAVFFSRSRQALWHKGSTSGNRMRVVSIAVDCDEDALLFIVVPAGPACHTGEISCFYRAVQQEISDGFSSEF